MRSEILSGFVARETEKVMRSLSNNIAIVAITLFAFAVATPASVGAQNLASFGILAGSTITNTGPSVINGNVGLSPGSSITGFPPGIVVAPGAIFNSDADRHPGSSSADYPLQHAVGPACDAQSFRAKPGRPYADAGSLRL